MKNIIRLSSVLICMIAISLSAQSQNQDMNESKYWFYRHRLLTEFLASGEDPCGEPSGLTIPCDKAYMKVDTSKRDDLGNRYDVQFRYGDGTSFLGYYIGVLATEFKLLSNNNAPVWQKDKVKEELYFAMKAFERLDRNAEKLISSTSTSDACNSNNNLNGFFLRDDVPAASQDNTVLDPAGARELNDKFKYKINREIQSDFGEHKDKPLDQLTGKQGGQIFISQDQAADMTLGLALVIKLMDNEGYQGYNFKQKAKENVNRIFSYMKDNDYFIPIPGKDGQCMQDLKEDIPADVKNFFNDFVLLFEHTNPKVSVNCLVRYGAMENRINAYALSQAGNIVYNEKMGAYDKFDIAFKPSTYDTYVSTLLKPVWDKLNYPFGEPYFDKNVELDGNGRIGEKANDWNNAIISTMAALGNSWEIGFKPSIVYDKNIVWEYGPCYHEEYWCVKKPRWMGGGCFISGHIRVPDLPLRFDCPISFGRVQVWCYSMPQEYLRDVALYNYLADKYKLGRGFTATLLTAASILEPKLCVPLFNPTNETPLPSITYNMTGYTLSKYGDKYGTQLYTLLHRVLHDGKGDYSYDHNQVQNILNSAPCNGPHYKPYRDPNVPLVDDEGIEGWRNDNRFQKTIDATRRNNANASFPGLDYMLFYNLNELAHGSAGTSNDQNTTQLNVSENNKTYPRQVSPSIIGSDLNPKRYVAYSSIVANTITVNAGAVGTNSNGNVTMKAGESIQLTNVTIKAGANFKAYIEKSSTPCATSTNRIADAPVVTEKPITDEEFATKVANALHEGIESLQASDVAPTQAYQSISSYLSSQGVPPAAEEIPASAEFNISVYPNPIDDVLSVSCPSTKIDQVVVCDQLGNELIQWSEGGQSQVQLLTAELPTGVFFVKVVSGGKVTVKKIIKIK